MPLCRSAIVDRKEIPELIDNIEGELLAKSGSLRQLLAATLGYPNWKDLMKQPKVLIRRQDLVKLLEAIGEPATPNRDSLVEAAYQVYCKPSIFVGGKDRLAVDVAHHDEQRFLPAVIPARGVFQRWHYELPGRACSAEGWYEINKILHRALRNYKPENRQEYGEVVERATSMYVCDSISATEFIRSSPALMKALACCQSELCVRQALAKHYDPLEHSASSLDELLELMLLMVQVHRCAA